MPENESKELRVYKVTLSVRTGVPINIPGYELNEKGSKELVMSSIKKLFKNCEIISIEEVDSSIIL